MVKNRKVSKQIIGGTFLSYLQMGFGVVINLLYTPLMIRALGQSEYGLYNTVASTISMLSILSLGFNSSYIRYFARYRKENDDNAIYRLNGLFLIIFSAIGVIAFGCGLFLTNHLDIIFASGLTTEEYGIAKILTLLLTINLSLSFPLSVFSNIISAYERFVFLKFLGIVRTVLSPLITLPLLLLGYGSVALTVVSVSVHIGVDIIYLLYVVFVLKQKFRFVNIEKGLLVDLIKYTSFIALNIVVDQINWNVDKILLGRFKGTAAVAVYSVGYTLYQYYSMFSSAISGVFTSRIHHIFQQFKENTVLLNSNLSDLFIRVGRLQFLVLALIATGVLFFGKPFIRFWAGAEYEQAYYVALLLIIPASIALIQNIGIEIQRAENKHQFRSIVYTIMALCNLGLTVVMSQLYGVIGAAACTAVSLIVANGIMMNIYYHKQCGLDIKLFWTNVGSQARGLIIPVIVGMLINHLVILDSVIMLLVMISVYSLIYIISMWKFGMNEYERNLIMSIFNRVGARND